MGYTEEIINKYKCRFSAEDLRISCGRIPNNDPTATRGSWVEVIHRPSRKLSYKEGMLAQKELLEDAILELKDTVTP